MCRDSATDDPEPDHANVCVLWLGLRCGTLHGVGSSAISLPTKMLPRNAEIWEPARSAERAPGARHTIDPAEIPISSVGALLIYIYNQPTHHCRRSFQQEYLEFLERHHVSFDERYILNRCIESSD